MRQPEAQQAINEILEGGGILYPFRNGYQNLAALLEVLPDEAWRQNEAVLGGLVFLLLKQGQIGRAKSYLRARNLTFEPTYRSEVLELLVTLHLGEHVSERKLADWRRLERKLPLQNTLLLGLYYNALLAVLVRLGKLDEARKTGLQAISCFREVGHSYLEHFIHIHLADIDIIEGQLTRAQRGLSSAERCLAQSGVCYGNELDVIDVVRMAIAYERGDFETVRAKSAILREALVKGDSWSELFFQLARISVLSTYFVDGPKAAQDELELFHADYVRRHAAPAATVDVLSSVIWRLEWNPHEAERALEALDGVEIHSAVGEILLAEQRFLLHRIGTERGDSPRTQLVSQLHQAQTVNGKARTDALEQALLLAYKDGQIAPLLENRDVFLGMNAQITRMPSVRRYPRLRRMANKVLRKIEQSYVVPKALQDIGLTPRQYRVLAALQSGATNKQVARQLGITEATVKYHLTSLFGLMGVSNRMELIEFTEKNEILSVY